MSNQLIFSKEAVSSLKALLDAPNGDERYLQPESFVGNGFKTLESPSISAKKDLANQVNPDSTLATAIALFEAYPNLNALEASSVGFWTYLTHVDLWSYMRARFPLDGFSSKERRAKIKSKWFLEDPSQSQLINHPLAGLWWGVKLSVVPERGEGRYDFTRILFRNTDLLVRTLGTYYIGRLPAAIRGILGYVFDHEDDFKSEYQAKMRRIMRHFNSLGGVVQLGCLDEAFYRDEIDRVREEWMQARKGNTRGGLVAG